MIGIFRIYSLIINAVKLNIIDKNINTKTWYIWKHKSTLCNISYIKNKKPNTGNYKMSLTEEWWKYY